ncbi:MAG: hypothetical protein E7321_05355 [Clostridiales bacterium]|nr:hypothetical protein [Clostridiales bacterium]
MKKFATVETIRAAINSRRDRSAWNKGVNLYALDLLNDLEERCAYEGREPETREELTAWLLNGAYNWQQYSEGACSLVCDCDIAERLCTPSELKRTHGGERQPNRCELWLDVQARALNQAATRIRRAYVEIQRRTA